MRPFPLMIIFTFAACTSGGVSNQPLETCMPGVWSSPPVPCNCTVIPTAECGTASCEERGITIYSEDGQYLETLIHTSASPRTYSTLTGLNRGTWMTTSSTSWERELPAMRTPFTATTCSGNTLRIGPNIRERAPIELGNSIRSRRDDVTWTAISY